ncbi:MAG: glycerate kinase [Chthoniobacterales bacterium]
MRIVIAPDKFKGSLSAGEVAEALKIGFHTVFKDSEYDLIPIADGGEGTSETFRIALGGKEVACGSIDALGRPIDTAYVWVADRKIAIIDMSAASGLWHIPPDERNPMKVSTYGTGLMIYDAISRGAEKIFVGLGGSATNDGGCGMAAALGWEFLDEAGDILEPTPEGLEKLHSIHPPTKSAPVEFVGLADVKNPLLGSRGASAVYGPQKGADAEMVPRLDAILKNVADCFVTMGGADKREVPGSGAAGGLGFGILAFLGGNVEPGFEAIADLVKLDEKIAAADLVLTGEGKLDSQTLEGKGPAGVAALARRHKKPVIAFGGAVADEIALASLFTACFAIANRPLTLEESEKEAFMLLELAAARVARVLKCGTIHE